MKRCQIFLTAVLLLLSIGAMAQGGTARAQLDAFSKGLHSMSGHFSQTLTGPNGETQPASSGTLALLAPRQFRWDTKKPYQQTIVADGSRVWLYDPSLEQVTVRTQSAEEAHSPLTVLTDVSQLDKNFKVTDQGTHEGFAWLRLTSTEVSPSFEYADLGFKDNQLARMRFLDHVGAVTDIQFSDWKRNAGLPPDTFNFVPPKGADVIGDLPVLSTRPLKP